MKGQNIERFYAINFLRSMSLMEVFEGKLSLKILEAVAKGIEGSIKEWGLTSLLMENIFNDKGIQSPPKAIFNNFLNLALISSSFSEKDLYDLTQDIHFLKAYICLQFVKYEDKKTAEDMVAKKMVQATKGIETFAKTKFFVSLMN